MQRVLAQDSGGSSGFHMLRKNFAACTGFEGARLQSCRRCNKMKAGLQPLRDPFTEITLEPASFHSVVNPLKE